MLSVEPLEAIAQLVTATNRNTTAIANLEEQMTRNLDIISKSL
ncbi:MAG: hypothetical protein ACRC2V_05790 [Xenococcaceae cyanobacterium]